MEDPATGAKPFHMMVQLQDRQLRRNRQITTTVKEQGSSKALAELQVEFRQTWDDDEIRDYKIGERLDV